MMARLRFLAALIVAAIVLLGCHTDQHKKEQEAARKQRETTERGVYGPDRTVAPAPSGAAAPRPGDKASGTVVVPVTVMCQWGGRRWIKWSVLRNGNARPLDPHDAKWTTDGRASDWRTGSGEVRHSENLAPGEKIEVVCNPHPGTEPGREDADMACYILRFKIIVARKQVNRGGVTCAYVVVP